MGERDHTAEVLNATIGEIQSSAALVAIWGDNIFDNPPQELDPPYGVVGAMSSIRDGADCIVGSVVVFTITGYSRTDDRQEALAIQDALVGLFTTPEGGMLSIEIAPGVWGDFRATAWTVDKATTTDGEWTARVNLEVTTSRKV